MYPHTSDREPGLAVLWGKSHLVRQVLPSWSLEFRLDPAVKITSPTAKGTYWIAHSQGESYILDYRAPVLLCFPAMSKQGCYRALPQPFSVAQAKDVLGRDTGVLQRVKEKAFWQRSWPCFWRLWTYLVHDSSSSSSANACRVGMNSCCCFSPAGHWEALGQTDLVHV